MRKLAVLTTFFAATVLYGQGPTKEVERLSGNWSVTQAVSGGAVLAPEVVKDFRLTINKDGSFSARLGDTEQRGMLSIDPTKKPLALDIAIETPPYKGKTQLAICELRANELRICAGDMDKKERPVDFDTKNKQGVTLLVLKEKP